MTAAERERLSKEGEAAQGLVIHNEPSPAGQGMRRVTVRVRFKDGQEVEFSEVLASLYQAEPGSPEAQRLKEMREAAHVQHPDRIPKIQLPLSPGETVPVRRDAAHHHKILIDVPAICKRALKDYIKNEQQARKREQQHAAGPVAGPPWIVPTHCPNCGAPVDQAIASRASDPKCEFCHQPVPVSPLR